MEAMRLFAGGCLFEDLREAIGPQRSWRWPRSRGQSAIASDRRHVRRCDVRSLRSGVGRGALVSRDLIGAR